MSKLNLLWLLLAIAIIANKLTTNSTTTTHTPTCKEKLLQVLRDSVYPSHFQKNLDDSIDFLSDVELNAVLDSYTIKHSIHHTIRFENGEMVGEYNCETKN